MSLIELRRPPWMAHGKCRGLDPELFHPTRGDNATAHEAMRVCQTCPVREECLEHALEHKEKGIWGGTSYRQRLRMTERESAA